MKQNTLQEIYDQLYLESAHRARQKGDKVPSEEEVFKVLIASCRAAIMRGEESLEILAELDEVRSFDVRKEEEERRKAQVDEALRHGYVIDLDAIK
jgi:hypothetical protein